MAIFLRLVSAARKRKRERVYELSKEEEEEQDQGGRAREKIPSILTFFQVHFRLLLGFKVRADPFQLILVFLESKSMLL